MKKILFAFLSFCTLHAQVQIQAPMPAQTSTFTGNVRGYWFIAPTCFTITGVQVPTDASTGNQSIAIMRLQSNPPLFSATTNAFDTLFVTQNNPNSGILPVNLIINQGDIIGVLGCRATTVSYSNAGNTTIIDGIPTALSRLGMQFQLPTNLPQQLWTEAATNIGRVFLYYDTTMLYNLTHTNLGANYTFADGTDTMYTSLFSVWDYGDGSPLDTNYNPTHTYTTNGNYNVCSYVHTSCGIDTVCTSISICILGANAGFTNSISGFDVSFSDASTNGSSWYWDFGDGDTSTLQNPSHTYAANGWYDITQIVSNSCGPNDTIIDSVLICVAATAAFTNSNIGLNATFMDASTNAISWNWDFGDGNNSTSQNPVNSYAAMGWYNVSLIVSNFCGINDTLTDSVLICTPPLSGTFTANNLNTSSVNFTDASTDATAWAWDFGDGNTSSLQSPTHNYASNGDYVVCLIVSNLCGSDTTCNTYTVCPSNPTANFTNTNTAFDANFNNSSAFATSSYWNFGDGNTSTSASPAHTYASAGTYFVCLTSYDNCGDSATFCDSVTIEGNTGIEEIGNIQSINTYPNPTNGLANISLNSPEELKGKLFITDITGKIVSIIYSGIFMQGASQYSINTKIWTDGIYLLVWETDKWKISKKLIVN